VPGPVELDLRVGGTHLATDADPADTALQLGHDAGSPLAVFPPVPFWLVLDPDDPSAREDVLVTALAGPVATVARAFTGGTARQHKAGSRARLDDVGKLLGAVAPPAVRTNNIGPFTTEVDFIGLSVTWTAVPGLRYRLSFHAARAASSVAGDRMEVYITDDANNHVAEGRSPVLEAANQAEGPISVWGTVTGLSGPVTYKVRGARATGTGSITIAAGAGSPATFLVEAVGVG